MEPGAVNRVRLWLLVLTFTTWPLLLGSLLSSGELGSSFGVMLVGTSLTLTVVVVSLIPPLVLMDRVVELGPAGVRVEARVSPGVVPWRAVRRVRVMSGRRRGRSWVSFILVSRRATIPIAVDTSQAPEAAEQVASALARFVPDVRRTGAVTKLQWDPAGRAIGTFSFEERFAPALSLLYVFGAAAGALSMDTAVLAGKELFPTGPYRLIVAGLYLVVVLAEVVLGWKVATTATPAHPEGLSRRARLWVATIATTFAVLVAAIFVIVLVLPA